MKRLGATIVGIAIAFLLVAASDWIVGVLAPIETIDPSDPDGFSDYIATMPLLPQLILVFGWFLAPLAGAWLALRIADWRPSGWIVVALFVIAGIVNQIAVPHPMWLQICAILLPLIGGVVAQRMHRKPYPGEPLLG